LYYQISCFGRVRLFKGKITRILKHAKNLGGRKYVGLYQDKTFYHKDIHLLVLIHFGPPKPSPIHECNHKDGNCGNNWWNNLEWMTHQENMIHAAENNLMPYGISHPGCKLSEYQVNRIRKLYKSGKYSQEKLAKRFEVAQTTISRIIRKIRWKHL